MPLKVISASEVRSSIQGNGPLEFDDYIIEGELDLSDLEIKGISHFNNTVFQDKANFGFTKFKGDAFFISSNFKEDADFSWSSFNGDADFRGAQFGGDAYFRNARFDQITDFKWSRFKSLACFEGASFIGLALFDGSHFADAFFDDVSFRDLLSLHETKYNKFYVRWYDIDNHLAFDETAYLLLIENLKNLGLSKDADSCYYRYRVEQLFHLNYVKNPTGYEFGLFSWLFLGFNIRPEYIIMSSFCFIIFFGIFWKVVDIRAPENQIDEYSLEYYSKVSKKTTLLEAFNYSAIVFFSGYGVKFLTQHIIEPPIMPKRSEILVKYTFILERVLGGFFTFIFAQSASKLLTGI